MRYKWFGGLNAEVSSICVGTWEMGAAGYGEVNDKD